VKVLLDTNTLIWAAMSSRSLSESAAQVLKDDANEIYVSAASAWEIATKVRLGKLPEAERLELRFLEAIEIAGYTLLSIDAASALRAGRFTGEHRDPFDRMIAAQAIAGDLLVLSNDRKLDVFGVRRLW
jgi:PIN domain nuclease of toxin-antitoxin system